jgi:TolB-like protein
MDLVESVRLMSANEVAVIDHWRGFVRYATSTVLPRHAGRLVKSLGDGIMAEFDSAREATAAALSLHRYFDDANASLPSEQKLYLRAGLNATHVYVDDIDIYGSGVNLAARVASLAGPGETMATAALRDGLDDGLDGLVEDMGDCYLKHVSGPVRAYRIGAKGPSPILTSEGDYPKATQSTVAVIPFTARSSEAQHFAIGELIADGVIAHLGKSAELKVVSRLATTALRDRSMDVHRVEQLLKADFILSGAYVVSGARLLVTAELVHAPTNEVLWVHRVPEQIDDLLQPDSQMCHFIAEACHQSILGFAVQQAMYRPLPTLAEQSLMFAGIAGVHQAARDGFNFSGKALSAVIERHPRHADAYAWLAKWYAIGTNRGLHGADSQKIATDLAERALQAAPESAFALTIAGLVRGFFLQDLDAAGKCYEKALSLNPSEPLAWLYTGTLRAWQGRAAEGAAAARRALELAPIGVAQYYVESLAALPLVCAGATGEAIALLRHSLRLNSSHTASHRVLAIALVMDGQLDAARLAARELMLLEPHFSVREFKRRYAGRNHPHALEIAAALAEAGVPLDQHH